MKKINKKNRYFELLIGILVISIFCFEAVGFAHYNLGLKLNGSLALKPDGVIGITNVILSDATNATETSSPIYGGNNISLSFSYNVTELESNYQIKYDITISNDSSYDYTFTGQDINADLNVLDDSQIVYSLDGIELGDVISTKSEKTFTVILNLIPATENTNYDVTAEVEESYKDEVNGDLLVAIGDIKTGNLKSPNTIAHFKIDVINTFELDKTFNLVVNSSAFELCNSSGGTLNSFTIPASSTDTFDFYVKQKSGASLPNNKEKLSVMYSYDGKQSNAGSISLLVDINFIDDFDPPVISNVTATQNTDVNSAHVTWSGTDQTTVDHYTVLVFNSSGTQIGSYNTEGSETVLDVRISNNDNNADGSYYFKVYGTDTSLPSANTASNTDIQNATTASGYCSRSDAINFKWYVSVSYTGTYSGNITETLLGKSFSVTIASDNTRAPTINSVKMGGNRLSNNANTGYQTSTNGSNRTITISNVTGDIEIDLSRNNGTCLVEGTKILLADGSEKNIEDIKYDDLLKVWNYETGSIGYEYPIWIEKSEETDSYQKTTFSDGTVLKTAGLHQVFSFDDMKFVNILEGDYIKVGTNVAIYKNGKLSKVKVKSVETIEEPVKYYYIASSLYYNVISNNIITTSDQITTGMTLSNMYGFDENIRWPKERKDIISKKNALYEYEDLNIMPYYLYYGSRGNETKYFVNKGYTDTNSLIKYLINTQLNPKMVVTPITNTFSKRAWMVTNSDDIVNSLNKSKYLIEEGSTYKLPVPKNINNFKCWYNHSDGKCYKPNDKVKIIIGTYFEAIYK